MPYCVLHAAMLISECDMALKADISGSLLHCPDVMGTDRLQILEDLTF